MAQSEPPEETGRDADVVFDAGPGEGLEAGDRRATQIRGNPGYGAELQARIDSYRENAAQRKSRCRGSGVDQCADRVAVQVIADVDADAPSLGQGVLHP